MQKNVQTPGEETAVYANLQIIAIHCVWEETSRQTPEGHRLCVCICITDDWFTTFKITWRKNSLYSAIFSSASQQYNGLFDHKFQPLLHSQGSVTKRGEQIITSEDHLSCDPDCILSELGFPNKKKTLSELQNLPAWRGPSSENNCTPIQAVSSLSSHVPTTKNRGKITRTYRMAQRDDMLNS
jgi:hypothetical protein